MLLCRVCHQPKSLFILNNKTVCLRCDDLLFDLEIELEQEPNLSPRNEVSQSTALEEAKKAVK